jgi:glycosyltransferase involved in cell wall biosynthesis
MDQNLINTPLVSVACITYNQAAFIHKTLKGFLAQKINFRYEIIIHDDASTDGTDHIIREYQAKYPELIFPIYQKENQFSKGIKRVLATFVFPKCKGRYIALCEGDDYWTDPLKLQKQVDFMEANPDYVICYHDAVVVDGNGNVIKSSKLPDELKRDFSGEELIKGNWILTLSMCFRNLLKDFPDESTRVHNGDTFLTSLLGNFGKGKYLSEIDPAVYRQHSGSVWSKLDIIEQLYHSGVTYAWLYRYYKRIGLKSYASHFSYVSANQFTQVLLKVMAIGGQQNIRIANNIFAEFHDIINADNAADLFAELRLLGYLTNPEKNNDNLKDRLGGELSHQQPKTLLELGEEKFSQGDIHAAVKIFERIIKLDNGNSQALNNLGVIQWRLGGIESALKTFQTAIALNPKDQDTLENFIQAATETSRFDLIDPVLLKTLKHDHPKNPGLLNLISKHDKSITQPQAGGI